jgi:hypothetical protein
MPLDTTMGADNVTRNLFNNGLRAWVRANNRILFDIADIEAHDTNGVPQTFVYTNRTWDMLFPGYTSDGGHLTTVTAQQMAGLGIYALGAALINADRDGDGIPDWWENANGLNPLDPADASADPDKDGMSNLQEYLAGTDPNNPASVLRTKVSFLGADLFQISFTASSNVTYVVQHCSAAAPASWTDLATVPSEPADHTVTLTDSASAPGRLYRVSARRDP